MKKGILLSISALFLTGGIFLPALAAGSRPASNVDRVLGKLRANTRAELSMQTQRRQIKRNQQLREQLSPGNPQNEIQKLNEELKSRLTYLEDNQKAEGGVQKPRVNKQ